MTQKVKGEIILIDDEEYEEDFLKNCLTELNYEIGVKYFQKAEDALVYLKNTDHEIFLIISDVHMPGMDGLKFKEIIENDPDTRLKSIPFVFATAAPTEESIRNAYRFNIQGYIKKPPDLKELRSVISAVMKYWIINLHPNKRVI